MNNLEILYEDNHIIVIVKPINVLSQSDITGDIDMLSLIKDYVKIKNNKPGNVYLGLVHRLDRVVGGVMVFAKTSKAASRLSEDIRLNKIHKTYLAIVHGKINDSGTYEDYLLKKDNYNTIISNQERGKYAKLSYRLLEYSKERNLSLVEVDLNTGRHHQIRVQFKSHGYPLIGDNRYNNDGIKDIGLYAYKLEFIHPIKKETMTFLSYPKTSLFPIFDFPKKS